MLSALESVDSCKYEIRLGGPIGVTSQLQCGQALSDEVADFCQNIFAAGGAVLTGAGGGRFVYDLRKRFDLFCKIVLTKTFDELSNVSRMKPEYVRNVDYVLIRENTSGIYQGKWQEESTPAEGRLARHEFSYSEKEVGAF